MSLRTMSGNQPTLLAMPTLLAGLLLACAPPRTSSPPPAAPPAASLRVPTADAAREIAKKAAVVEGYAIDVYPVRSVELVGPEGESFAGMWRVRFEHVPPAPPGGHFIVFVDASTGSVRLVHGE
jgi:hypothetical protein